MSNPCGGALSTQRKAREQAGMGSETSAVRRGLGHDQEWDHAQGRPAE